MTSARTLQGLLARGARRGGRDRRAGAPPLTYAGLRALVDETIALAQRASASAAATASRSCCRTARKWRRLSSRVASGATSAPLNPAYRADEFEFYMSDLGAKALVVEAGGASPALAAAEKLGIAVLTLTPDREAGAGALPSLRRSARRRGAARPRRGRRRRADPAHVGHDLAAEDRAAERKPMSTTSAENIAASLEFTGSRSRPQRHAAVSHPRADRRPARAAVARRLGLLHAGLQRAEVLRRDGGGEADLVHGGADHASGDSDARGAKQGRSSRAIRCASSARRRPRCRRR